MGLDISAYKNIRKVPVTNKDDQLTFYLHYDFESFQHFELSHAAAYEYDDSISMRAGSYGGYNSWRSKLEEVSASLPTDASGKPAFIELTDYSDCEGAMGTSCCIKLAHDFIQYEQEVKKVFEESYFKKYLEWKSMFIFASNNGAVHFH